MDRFPDPFQKAMNGDPDVDMTPVLGEAWVARSKSGQSSKLDTANKVWDNTHTHIDVVRSYCSATHINEEGMPGLDFTPDLVLPLKHTVTHTHYVSRATNVQLIRSIQTVTVKLR